MMYNVFYTEHGIEPIEAGSREEAELKFWAMHDDFQIDRIEEDGAEP